MSSFESAAKKLAETSEPYPLDDLPIDSNDEVSWKEIRETYGLTLPELVALKNYKKQQQQQQQEQQQQQQWVATNESFRLMHQDAFKFFFETKLGDLTLTDKRWIMNVHIMAWTTSVTNHVYWRSCYSNILCSVIGGLEHAFSKWKAASAPDSTENIVRTEQFVITGTQGTGKSILGAFLGLVLSQAYGWLVKYQYGSESNVVTFGDKTSEKNVLIWDGSSGGEVPQNPGQSFLVMVTSYKAAKWSYIAQQGSWSRVQGNLIFINPTPEKEIEAIAQAQASSDGWKTQYEYAGGIPRICLLDRETAKDVIDKACEQFATLQKLPSSVDQLLQEDKTVNSRGQKVYPGLVAHFIPTLPFRADHQLAIASSYVGEKIRQEVKKAREKEVHETMRQLLQIKKARSLVGWIWEPFFSKKTLDKASVSFIGCALPAKNNRVSTLLESTSDYVPLVYEDLEDFRKKFNEKGQKHTVIGKAKKDNAEAIDGIIVKRNPLKVIGVQLCVSESKHDVTEKGVEEIQQLHEAICGTAEEQTSPAAELWFVQPEECLEADFDFVSMQALKFKHPKQLPHESNNNRKRKRTAVLSSNQTSLWSDTAQKVTQYLAIPVFGGSTQPTANPSAEAIKKKLREAVTWAKEDQIEKNDTASESQPEPRLRSVATTITVAKSLVQDHNALFWTLMDDLAADGIVESTNSVEGDAVEELEVEDSEVVDTTGDEST